MVIEIINSQYIDVKTIITVVFALIGLWITHFFTSRRDRKNKIRETNLTYVKRAYDNINLAMPLMHVGKLKSGGEYIEKAFTDIQIHGTKEQIDAVNKIIQTLNSGKFNFDPIINSLRDYLRKELGLPKEDRTVLHISFPVDDERLSQRAINQLPKQDNEPNK